MNDRNSKSTINADLAYSTSDSIIHDNTLTMPDAGSYKVLVVDPPWNQGKTGKRSVRPNQGTRLDYPTMSKAQLLALPINEWSEDQSFLRK